MGTFLSATVRMYVRINVYTYVYTHESMCVANAAMYVCVCTYVCI